MKLIHPIYLDVPMLISFAAAIGDGLSLASEVMTDKTNNKDTTTAIEGKAGLSKLFSSLFEVSAKANFESQNKEINQEITKEIRSHTELSIAILLYTELKKKEQFIKTQQNIQDFTKLNSGSLVELSGTLEKNAVDTIIDYIDAISIMTKLDNKNKNSNKDLNHLRGALDKDRKRTPISNALLKDDSTNKLTSIVTLRTENLRDLTLSELNHNQVTIVGKVTRIIKEEEEISTFENYGMSMVHPDTLNTIFSEIRKNKDMLTDIPEITIKGPALQILPLMIFV